MIEGQCSACGGPARQPVGGGSWSHNGAPCNLPGAAFTHVTRKTWPPTTETK